MKYSIALLILTGWLLAGANIESHNLQLTIDPETHGLQATDVMKVSYSGKLEFGLGADYEITKIEINGKTGKLKALGEQDHGLVSYRISTGFKRKGQVEIKLTYNGNPFHDPENTSFSREKIAMEISGTISPEGVFLSPSNGFYPHGDQAVANFKVAISLPGGWDAVSEGARVEASKSDDSSLIAYTTEHPLDGIHITAAQWVVDKAEVNGVEFYTFFFPEDTSLAKQYLDMSIGYVARYDTLITPYPFSKFAVVENFFPTGYGMPSYTVLGRSVVRLPFIVYTSLGHEVLHNWWGNSVFIGEGGNWCEGLTSYQADYLYKTEQSEASARQYRKDILKDYTVYTRDGDDFAPAEFTSRSNMSSRSIGYGKVAMIFMMLEDRVGSDAFYMALRQVVTDYQWGHASWANFISAIELASGHELGAFKTSWVDEAGAPLLSLELTDSGFVLKQSGAIKPVQVPIQIIDNAGNERIMTITFDSSEIALSGIDLSNTATVSVDPAYRVMRYLHADEIDPTLRDILSSDDLQIVIPDNSSEWSELAGNFQAAVNSEGSTTIIASGGDVSDDTPAIYLGVLPEGGIAGIDAQQVRIDEESFATDEHSVVWAHRTDSGTPRLLIYSTDIEQLHPLARKVPHYGKYGYLVFNSGSNVAKGNHQVTTSPLVWKK
jgi:hypothetical protein